MRPLVLALVIAGCPAADPPAPPPRPPGAVPYDCAFADPSAASCTPSPVWIAELDRMGARAIEPGDDPLSQAVCRRAAAALDQALAADPARLTEVERIVAQNGALRLVGPKSCERDGAGGISRRASQAILHLALPAAALDALGGEPWSDLESWLGPHSDWVDRRSEHAPLFHDTIEFFTQAFRPLRSGSTHAVVSQMVAIDTAWHVHVTPVVGRIELRRGDGLGAPACIGKLDAARLRCRAGRLRPVPEADLPTNAFVQRPGPGLVDCNRCHAVPEANANLVDLPAGDVDALTTRRALFLEGAEEGVETIRTRLQ